MKRVVFLLVMISIVFAASMASAALLRFDSVSDPLNVTISVNNGAPQGTVTGKYNVTVDGTPTTAVCIENQTINYGSQGAYILSPITEQKYMAAAWVLSQGWTDAAHVQARQIAIWELVWDWTTLFDLNANNFRLISPNSTQNPGLWTLTGEIWNAAQNAVLKQGYTGAGFVMAENASLQDFIIVNPPGTVVPIPAAAWLLGTGLLGLVVIRRRMKK